jgi:hypothetical protein
MKWVSLSSVLAACLALGAPALLTGCGASVADYCEQMCDCEGCSDNQLDDCIDEGEDVEDDAEREGCDDQFDELISCLDDEAECRGDDFDADGCEEEEDDLDDCLDSSSGSGDPPEASGSSSGSPGE